MELNQVTLPALDVSASVAFYRAMGFELIVDEPHYARFKSTVGAATFSVHAAGPSQNNPGRSCISSAHRSTSKSPSSRRAVWSSYKSPETNRGCGAKRVSWIHRATSFASITPAKIGSTRRGESRADPQRWALRRCSVATACSSSMTRRPRPARLSPRPHDVQIADRRNHTLSMPRRVSTKQNPPILASAVHDQPGRLA